MCRRDPYPPRYRFQYPVHNYYDLLVVPQVTHGRRRPLALEAVEKLSKMIRLTAMRVLAWFDGTPDANRGPDPPDSSR
jgi:hypothetical protein